MAKSQANIKPLFDYVLVKPVKSEEVLPSGIVIPDSAKEKPQIGEIMAVGPGAHNEDGKLIPMLVKIGQKVLYKKWGGNEVKVGMEEWLLIEQKDVMAVVE
jgi:chaperonin GroES